MRNFCFKLVLLMLSPLWLPFFMVGEMVKGIWEIISSFVDKE